MIPAKNVVLLTEAGRGVGFGHLVRCRALKSAIKHFGGRCRLVVANQGECPLEPEEFAQDWFNSFEKVVREQDIAIVDSYLASEALLHQIAKQVPFMACFDDTQRLVYPGQVVINGALFAEQTAYPKGPHYLKGSIYAPLRPEFAEPPTAIVADQIKSVLVTFGGDDSRGMGVRIAHAIGRKFRDLQIVVLHNGSPSVEGTPHVQVRGHLTAVQMRKAIEAADLVISAAGTSLYEIAALGKPAVVVQVADNQKPNVEAFTKLGSIKFAGLMSDPEIENKITDAIAEWDPISRRQQAQSANQANVDGEGAKRIARALLELALLRETNFRPALWSDGQRLLDWRNDALTVKNSLSQAPVPGDQHWTWLRAALANRERVLWVYESEGQAAGTVRFEVQETLAQMSWTVAPEFRGHGHGAEMVSKASQLFRQRGHTITAQILSSNQASIAVALKAGFQMVQVTDGVTSWTQS